jgi:hypothetical protein
LDDAIVGEGHVTATAVTSRVSSDATIEAFSRMSDQGFIGEIEASSGGVISQFWMGENRGRFVIGEERIVRIEGFMCDI